VLKKGFVRVQHAFRNRATKPQYYYSKISKKIKISTIFRIDSNSGKDLYNYDLDASNIKKDFFGSFEINES